MTATMSGTATALASFSYPSPISFGYPNMDVLAISPEDRSVRYKWRSISPSGGEVWNPTNETLGDLSGKLSNVQHGVAAESRTPGIVDIFVFGVDNALYHMFNSSEWTNKYEDMGGIATSPPAVVSWGADRQDIFLIGTDYALHQMMEE
jgi:hypothetical protein